MVVIRLSRGGAKKRPFYRVVVADSRMPRDGRFIEQIGTFDPRLEENQVKLQLDRVDAWVEKGAKLSDRVRDIVKDYRKASAPTEA